MNTIEEISLMSIEKIIHLPNFKQLTSCGGIENRLHEYQPVVTPHWEIKFRAEPIGDGKFKCFDKVVPFDTLVVHIYKNSTTPQQ